LRSFGRIGGRALSPLQERLIADAMPQVAVGLSTAFDTAATFGRPVNEVWLEVGFGGAEHLVGQAKRHPDVGLIGCEPFIEGVAKALTGLKGAGLLPTGAVRLHQGDAREVIDWLPEAALSRVFILFPDPWPKQRHHKRRLINPTFLASLAHVVRPGGRVRFATDWADYADWTLAAFLPDERFRWLATQSADWTQPPADHITTRYQEKQLGDCAPVFFDFERVETDRRV
jgi:tRNA (guanine-N7-)-methyltransferase